jgi:anti-sigma factor RsiW
MDEACRRTFEEVEAYLDGDLDETACRRLEEHAARCSVCADTVQRLRRTIGMCRQAGRTPLPESVRQRAREAVRRLLEGGTP